MSSTLHFQEIFDRLRMILHKYEEKLVVVTDTPSYYYLDSPKINPLNKKPNFFGAVKLNKNYVSFYLMPVYACPSLVESFSEDLKKHKKGKSCFNIKKFDNSLFDELEKLTENGFEFFKLKELV
ncbi:DUF1801 domain-containing protein [Bacillus sp. RG28]|uniref:DUF1801 domain-containing protein n=1 Tax=Gottfriedia endophytica TaxID=2820819 RepID=A0A940NLW0_9BACI|nr:DUF1801 domain-containing protein [Gottfriedia endophytica]MBP0723915.1 DUF1801 domain-containing protein [Gottfriedia endophytica]